MAERKYETHFVCKIEDAKKYLDEEQYAALCQILCNVDHGRCIDGKKINRHIVCNCDEPYSGRVLQVILNGEDAKANTLKPCPFCAGMAKTKNNGVANHAVYCTVCEAQTRMYYDTPAAAAEAWNHRIDL